MPDEEQTEKTTTILIEDTDAVHRFAVGRVPVSVNGQIAHVEVGKKTEVGEHVIGVLRDAGIPFTVVEPEGSAGSSAEGVSVDDPRDIVVPADDPAGSGADDENATKLPDSLEQDVSPPSGDESGEPKNAANSGGNTADETVGGILSKTIPDLTTALGDISDPSELDALLDAEKNGANRSGAISAIEARKAALTN